MKVESTLSGQRRQWPVYTEITRQERAERASQELMEDVRQFQRQNDKFIGREPKVRSWCAAPRFKQQSLQVYLDVRLLVGSMMSM